MAAFAAQFFAVLQFMLATRWLGQDQLGIWAMFLTLVSFFEMARLGLIQPAVVHFMAHADVREKSQLRSAALIMSVAIALPGAFVLLGFAALFNQIWHLPGLMHLFYWFPVIAVLTSVLRWHDALHTAAQDFKGVSIVALVFGAASTFFILLFHVLLPEFRLEHLLLAQIPAALICILLRFRALKALSTGFEVNRNWLFKIYRFGRFGMGSNLFSMLFQRADMLLLGAIVPPAALATYNVATRLITWMDFPLNALSQVFAPKIAAESRAQNSAGIATAYRDAVSILLALSLPLYCIAFIGADYWVYLLAGKSYAGAAFLLRIMVIAGLAKPFGRMLGVALDAGGQPQQNFKMIGFSLIINLLLLILLAPIYGISGAAVAGTLGIFITTIAGQIFFRKQLMPGALPGFTQIWSVYSRFSRKIIKL